MQGQLITKSSQETKELGKTFSREVKGGQVVCLEGDLGAGKTTFTQGLLEGLGAVGPYTSPTFVVMKEYKVSGNPQGIENIYHIDAYRVSSQDVSDLGWEELVASPKNLIIVEWAERLADILPGNALKINCEWVSENERKITS